MKHITGVLILCILGSLLFAKDDLKGLWDTGRENTKSIIFEKKDMYFGEIISSDNEKAKTGTQILKEIEQNDGEWTGKIYAMRQQKWFNAKIKPKDGVLNITIKAGFMKRTVKWKKVLSE